MRCDSCSSCFFESTLVKKLKMCVALSRNLFVIHMTRRCLNLQPFPPPSPIQATEAADIFNIFAINLCYAFSEFAHLCIVYREYMFFCCCEKWQGRISQSFTTSSSRLRTSTRTYLS